MRPGPARASTPWPPRRRIGVVGDLHERGRLFGSRLGFDRPVDDPAEIEDGNLHDHHQPDQLPHDGLEFTPACQPATAASSFPLISALPWPSYCVTSNVARARPAWIPPMDAIRTGSRASTS